jgi:hypothetical protein
MYPYIFRAIFWRFSSFSGFFVAFRASFIIASTSLIVIVNEDPLRSLAISRLSSDCPVEAL